jgi:hypothetical protein
MFPFDAKLRIPHSSLLNFLIFKYITNIQARIVVLYYGVLDPSLLEYDFWNPVLKFLCLFI